MLPRARRPRTAGEQANRGTRDPLNSERIKTRAGAGDNPHVHPHTAVPPRTRLTLRRLSDRLAARQTGIAATPCKTF